MVPLSILQSLIANLSSPLLAKQSVILPNCVRVVTLPPQSGIYTHLNKENKIAAKRKKKLSGTKVKYDLMSENVFKKTKTKTCHMS